MIARNQPAFQLPERVLEGPELEERRGALRQGKERKVDHLSGQASGGISD
jgi:hypothetical protein